MNNLTIGQMVNYQGRPAKIVRVDGPLVRIKLLDIRQKTRGPVKPPLVVLRDTLLNWGK